jgi:uncharacterized protein YegP (UPF0339 family)
MIKRVNGGTVEESRTFPFKARNGQHPFTTESYCDRNSQLDYIAHVTSTVHGHTNKDGRRKTQMGSPGNSDGKVRS